MSKLNFLDHEFRVNYLMDNK